MKDVMVLRELGYSAIAFNSEGIPTKGENKKFIQDTIANLQLRFTEIAFFMDNDVAGLNYTVSLSKAYNLPAITIPTGQPKDISDYIEKYGQRKTKSLLKKIISKAFNHGKQQSDFLSLANTYATNSTSTDSAQ